MANVSYFVTHMMRAAALALVAAGAIGCSQGGEAQENAYAAQEPEESQTSQSAQEEPQPAAAQPETNPVSPAPAPTAPAAASATESVGKAVFDSSGREIGKVAEIAKAQDGSEQIVISVGDFLGMQPKEIAVPATSFHPSPDGKGLMVSMTAEEVDAAPPYEAKAGSDAGAEPAEDPEGVK